MAKSKLKVAVEDPGHSFLVQDLEKLLKEAKEFEFHDFKNSTYEAPKMELYDRLGELAANVQEGKYDNQ